MFLKFFIFPVNTFQIITPVGLYENDLSCIWCVLGINKLLFAEDLSELLE